MIIRKQFDSLCLCQNNRRFCDLRIFFQIAIKLCNTAATENKRIHENNKTEGGDQPKIF